MMRGGCSGQYLNLMPIPLMNEEGLFKKKIRTEDFYRDFPPENGLPFLIFGNFLNIAIF